MAGTLVGPNGSPISSSQFKKAPPPKMGGMGRWAGQDQYVFQLPGGAVLQFNLNALTLSDYRAMRDHYQINANLTVLTFMLHQADWKLTGGNAKVRNQLQDNLEKVWTRLVRAISQSFWAGYSPNVLEFENDLDSRAVVLNKIKDLVPEECTVNWKTVDGWAPDNRVKPKIKLYDGIKQIGAPYPYPVSNTFWYPLLMENGNYYGKKLLRPAFPSWFFSILLHLFANRYYERFGEPVPVGRADFENTVMIDGEEKTGREAMQDILTQLRNRSVVVLPSEKEQVGTSGNSEYVFDIEYLESQMRGADFERYMSRLDEEMSLSLFTPILMLRTSDVGSYNLGTSHMQLFLWMLNALLGDMQEYIQRYIVTPLKNFNSSVNAEEIKIEFRKLGKQDGETVRAIVTEMIRSGKAKPDVDELGTAVGMTLQEVQEVQEPIEEPIGDETDPTGDGKPASGDPRTGSGRPERSPVGGRRTTKPGSSAASKEISARVGGQVAKAYRQGTFDSSFSPSLGFRNRFQEELERAGVKDAAGVTEAFYVRMDEGTKAIVESEPSNHTEFMAMFDKYLQNQLDVALDAA